VDFKKDFEERFKRTVEDYGLISPGEKVLVACSGGKDSTVVLYVLKSLGFDIEALTVDLHIGDYSRKNVVCVEEACNELGVRLHKVEFRQEYGCSVCYLRSILWEKHKLRSCTVCGVIRRALINKKAREIGADKIATGHNLDDEAQTVLMNLMQGDVKRSCKMGPLVGQIRDKKFIPRIKPLFFIKEEDIKRYCKESGFPVVYEPCPCSVETLRTNLKRELDTLEKSMPDIKAGLVNRMIEFVPAMREKYKYAREMQYCEECGEPTSKKICKSCELFAKARTGTGSVP
jgi:uncharacterized protein (TIGR00269 family)